MTKSISAGMRTHLDGTTTSLTTLWRIIRRDGQNFYFTDHDVNILFDDGDGEQTYLAAVGYDRSAIVNRASLAVDNLDVSGIVDSSNITLVDLVAGRFDNAEVRIMVVNWKNTADGMIRMKRGRFGEVRVNQQGSFTTEFRGLSQALGQNILGVYGPECRADLGDNKCRVPILPDVLGRNAAVVVGEFYRVDTAGGGFQSAYENRVYEVTTAGTTAGVQPSYDTVIGNTTADGTAVLTARDAFMRHATIATVIDDFNITITVDEPRAVDDWFNLGALEFEEGDNNGLVREIVDWTQSNSQVQFFLRFPFTPVVGQRVRLYRGCDKRLETCSTVFSNAINFRGFPHLPGPDTTLTVEA